MPDPDVAQQTPAIKDKNNDFFQKHKNVIFILAGLAVAIIAYILIKGQSSSSTTSSTTTPASTATTGTIPSGFTDNTGSGGYYQGPTGETGPAGPAGPAGPTGPAGTAATNPGVSGAALGGAATAWAPTPAPAVAAPVTNYYTVKSGDTLSGIASTHGTTWQAIYANPQNASVIGSNPNLIMPGQRLIIG
jgi:LysM repeat protein